MCENGDIVVREEMERGEEAEMEPVEGGEEEQQLGGAGQRSGRSRRRAGAGREQRRQPADEHQPRHSKRDFIPVQHGQRPHPVVQRETVYDQYVF